MEYNEEELLAKAKKPMETASALHSYYKGKIAGSPKCRVKDLRDFDVAAGVVKTSIFEFAASWNISAIPMFLLMGAVAHHSGIKGLGQ